MLQRPLGHEAHAISMRDHLNICTLCDLGPNYLLMEQVHGVPL
jgi:hypothetical protein